MKKSFTAFFVLMLISSGIFATELTFRFNPEVLVPTNEDYDVGFGISAQADFDLFGFLTVGGEVFGLYDGVKSLSDPMYYYGGGLGVGGYYFPLSRLYLGAGASFGIYQVTTSNISSENNTSSDFYWRGYGEVGFRFNPSITLSLNGGYKSLLVYNSNPFLEGFTAGLSLRYSIPVGSSGSSSFSTTASQETAAFPLYMSAYRNNPLGTIIIRNNEGAEIRNVHISFRAGKYTASTYESAQISKINKYSSIEVPLYTDFSAEILKLSENGKVAGEIVIEYEFLGKKQTVVQNAAISVYNRNAFSWSDISALSCFISPDTPEVLELSKWIAGIARSNFYTGMNRSVQLAAAMTEGLNLFGIRYNEDKVTPYISYHTGDQIDYIQYPLQTINYLGGDYDDMGILLASCLESVGIETAYLALPEDFIVLVSAEIRPGTEANSFGSTEGLIVDDQNVYFGISMKNFNKGFTAARKAASKAIAAALKDENYVVEYTNVHASWEIYSPCVFSENMSNFEKPSESELIKRTNAAIKDYMNDDLSEILARAKKSGNPNKIGVAYMRLGRYAEAKAEFTKSGTVSAMNNLGTVYMIEKNYSAAASTYKSVLAKDPSNAIAKKGLENANTKLGL